MPDELEDRFMAAVCAMADSLGGYAVPMCEFPADGIITVFADQECKYCFELKVAVSKILTRGEESE